MATIYIHRAHALSAEKVRDTAESIARRVERQHAVSWSWEGDSLHLVAPRGPARGVRGRVTVGAAHVAIEIDLPLPLRAVKGMVEKRLSAKLDTLLGPA